MTRISDITVTLTASFEKFHRAIDDARRGVVRLADTWHDQWLYSLPWYRQWWHFLWCKR
jgi:hypothetical protein